MKRGFALIPPALLAVICVSCNKETAEVPIPAPAPPIPTPLRTTPAPATPAPIVAATPLPHHYAPVGTFYVIQYFSIETDSGITGIKPGTKVKQISDLGESIKATDGQAEFTVKKEYVTNDLEVASEVARIDYESQAMSRGASSSISIISATYGIASRGLDVTNYVRQEVAAGRTEIRVGNQLCGNRDPYPGQSKSLTVSYSVGANPSQTVTAKEGGAVMLASPYAEQQIGQQPAIQYVPVPQQSTNPLDRDPYHEKKVTTGRTIYIPR